MRYFEVEGESPEEILSIFLSQQDIPKDYVSVEVLEHGAKGLLGIGKKRAKVKIIYNDIEHIKRKSKLIISEILERGGFNDFIIAVEEKNNIIRLNIEIERPDILIGKMAQTLDSYQYILDKMLRVDENTGITVMLDVTGYRERMVAEYIEKAKSMAEEVKQTGKLMKMPPMTTFVRKEIHIALKNEPGISTVSTGEGQIKQLCIIPEKKKK